MKTSIEDYSWCNENMKLIEVEGNVTIDELKVMASKMFDNLVKAVVDAGLYLNEEVRKKILDIVNAKIIE
jgi:hypothetical protein